MAKEFTVPYGAWSGENEHHILEFPENWG